MRCSRILLIDDDNDEALIFCEALSEIDNSIQCYTDLDGYHAFNSVNQLEIQPDLIFLDINMPRINGWETLQLFKQDLKLDSIPIIMYSTTPSERDIEKAKIKGAASFFVKPGDYIELRQGLNNILQLFETHSPLGGEVYRNSEA